MIYYGFSDKADVAEQFSQDDGLPSVDILYAAYNQEGYEGSAYVLFYEEGKLWEVEASHCSCNGLEDAWVPVETSIATLLQRHDKPESWEKVTYDLESEQALAILLSVLQSLPPEDAAERAAFIVRLVQGTSGKA